MEQFLFFIQIESNSMMKKKNCSLIISKSNASTRTLTVIIIHGLLLNGTFFSFILATFDILYSTHMNINEPGWCAHRFTNWSENFYKYPFNANLIRISIFSAMNWPPVLSTHTIEIWSVLLLFGRRCNTKIYAKQLRMRWQEKTTRRKMGFYSEERVEQFMITSTNSKP